MYQANLTHLLAKSMLPNTMQDYNAALSNAASFLKEIEKAHANPMPGDPLAKSTFSQSSSPISGLTYYDLETGAKFVYPFLTPLRNETPRVSGKGGVQANWRAVTGINTTGLRIGVSGGNRGGVQAEALERVRADGHIHLRTPADGGRDLDEKTPWGEDAIYEVILNWVGD